jgi:diguanylate cyclase (GGDEF)-like protein/PAS domain S-box-containing protein
MSPRAAAPGAVAIEPAGSHMRLRPGDPTTLAGALAILDAHRRDKLLEAVAIAAKELLRSSDLSVSLPKVIEQIGHATGVDRAHIFLVDAAGGEGKILQHHVWTVPGIATPPEFQNAEAPMANVGLKSWIPRLERGETIVGHVRDFDSAARAQFDLAGVKSTLWVPMFGDGQWLGMIFFDDCHSERDWSPAEIDTVKTVAELVGAAVARTSRLQTLADANRIIENSSTILYRLSPQQPFQLIYLSQNVRRYGYDADQLLASPDRWLQLFESEYHPIIAADIKSIIEGKTEHTLIEFRLKKSDGSFAWLEGRGYAVRDEERRLVAIEGILTDITERKRSESELSFSHILLTTALENSPDAIIIVDASDRIIMSNQHFIELWDIPPEFAHAGIDEPVLKTVASRMKYESKFLAGVRDLYNHPEIQNHEELETKDGRIIERHSGSLYDAQRKYLGRIWFFRDITEKKRAAEKIAALARTDALTGLANRAAFLDRLNLEFARAKRGGNQFAVHYLDLDHFKDINDTLGHPIGDKLLCAVAERLKACGRETDMVARFGGDEFAVLQDDIGGSASVGSLAAKIGEVVAAPYVIEGNQMSTTASIGIVPFSGDIADADVMMMKADLALYRAKNEGRNQFRFHVVELDEQTRERMIIGEELRHAIKRGEFELYYQPQVEIKSGRIVGMEALIRWNHPKRGLMLPAAFIPIAETTGSIVPIGEWVIDHACQQIMAWNGLGIAPPTIAVNLSGAQFKLASQLDKIVTENLARYDVAPERLELELTESVLLETTQRHSEAFKRLRKIGVRLAIDDFGTGYSSLDYLRSFRVSRLKIDRRFITDVTTSADDAAIVRATVGLAHELGIEVVAEGVETAGQRDFLIAARCSFAQGYYFSEPVPAAAASELLRHNLQFAPI